jgi:hypothetical protein
MCEEATDERMRAHYSLALRRALDAEQEAAIAKWNRELDATLAGLRALGFGR